MREIAAEHPERFTKDEFMEWFAQSAFWESKMQHGRVASDEIGGKYTCHW